MSQNCANTGGSIVKGRGPGGCTLGVIATKAFIVTESSFQRWDLLSQIIDFMETESLGCVGRKFLDTFCQIGQRRLPRRRIIHRKSTHVELFASDQYESGESID